MGFTVEKELKGVEEEEGGRSGTRLHAFSLSLSGGEMASGARQSKSVRRKRGSHSLTHAMHPGALSQDTASWCAVSVRRDMYT